MMDVVLISVAGVFQLIVTWYAVDISVHENRIKNGVVIGVIGLAAICLTAWAAYDSFVSQEKLAAEVTAIRAQLSGASVGLSQLVLSPPIQQLTPEKELLIGMVFTVSEGTAKNMRCNLDAFSLPGKESDEQNRIAISKFRQEIAESQGTGEDRIAGTSCYKGLLVKLNENQISDLLLGNRVIYVMGHAEWNNESGADFHTDVCKWMEQPKTRVLTNPGWHDCSR